MAEDSTHDALRVAAVVEATVLARVLATALQNRALVAEYDRLHGTNLCGRGTAVERAVDAARGRTEMDLTKFLAFAKDVVWDRLDDATRMAIRTQVAQECAA